MFDNGVSMTGLADKLKYLDPGSGSILVQLLIAGLAGLGIAVATGWKKLKGLFGGSKNKPVSTETEDEEDD